MRTFLLTLATVLLALPSASAWQQTRPPHHRTTLQDGLEGAPQQRVGAPAGRATADFSTGASNSDPETLGARPLIPAASARQARASSNSTPAAGSAKHTRASTSRTRSVGYKALPKRLKISLAVRILLHMPSIENHCQQLSSLPKTSLLSWMCCSIPIKNGPKAGCNGLGDSNL